MNRSRFLALLLATGLLQGCSHTAPPAPLAMTPLLRIDDARTLAPPGPPRPPPASANPAPLPQPEAAGMLALTPSRMEVVQLGPNEFRLQYRQPVVAAMAEAAPAAPAALQIVNGNGVRGMGERVRRLLARHGIATAQVVNKRGAQQRRTIIEYLPGQRQRAAAMLTALQGQAMLQPARALPDGLALRLVLGRDHAARIAALPSARAMPLVALSATAVPHFNQE